MVDFPLKWMIGGTPILGNPHSPTATSGELETAQLLTEKARAQLQGVRQELSAECAAAKAGEAFRMPRGLSGASVEST